MLETSFYREKASPTQDANVPEQMGSTFCKPVFCNLGLTTPFFSLQVVLQKCKVKSVMHSPGDYILLSADKYEIKVMGASVLLNSWKLWKLQG